MTKALLIVAGLVFCTVTPLYAQQNDNRSAARLGFYGCKRLDSGQELCVSECDPLMRVGQGEFPDQQYIDKSGKKPEDWTENDFRELRKTIMLCTENDPGHGMLFGVPKSKIAEYASTVAAMIKNRSDAAKKENSNIEQLSSTCQSALKWIKNGSAAGDDLQNSLQHIDALIKAGEQQEACDQINKVHENLDDKRLGILECRSGTIEKNNGDGENYLALAGGIKSVEDKIGNFGSNNGCGR